MLVSLIHNCLGTLHVYILKFKQLDNNKNTTRSLGSVTKILLEKIKEFQRFIGPKSEYQICG
jgi:hypothetical protein